MTFGRLFQPSKHLFKSWSYVFFDSSLPNVENSVAKLFPKNTVVIALTGATTGNVGFLTFETSTNQSITGIFPSEKFVSKFLFFLLIFMRPQNLRFSLGTAQPHINQQIVKDLKIPLPPLPEQQKIASILSNLDLLIQQEKQYKEKLEKIKRGLMQQLLTGQKRVKV